MKNKILNLFLIAFILTTSSSQAQVIDVKQSGEKYDKYWSRVVGAGRANEELRAGWLEQLALSKQYCGIINS